MRMPAEWEPHESTWLSWPVNRTTWPGKLLGEVEGVFIEMMRGLLPGEKVNLLVPDGPTARKVKRKLEARKTDTKNLIFHRVKTQDAWIRDYGPIFVKRVIAGREAKDRSCEENEARRSNLGLTKIATPVVRRARDDNARIIASERNDNVAFTKWNFNAWGGKYASTVRDNQVVNRLEALKKFRRFDTGIVLEGGSIDVNGCGVLLTSEQCLLNRNRNPRLSRREIENAPGDLMNFEVRFFTAEGESQMLDHFFSFARYNFKRQSSYRLSDGGRALV